MKYLVLTLALLALTGCPERQVRTIVEEPGDIIVEPIFWDVVCDDVDRFCVLFRKDGTGQRVIFKYKDTFNRVHFPELCRGWLR